MKKIILTIAAVMLASSANAQMADLIGSMGIEGVMEKEGYDKVAQGQMAVNQLKFEQDIASLVSDLETTYMGNYSGITKETLNFNGFAGIDWDISANAGGFVLEFKNLDARLCMACKNFQSNGQKVVIDGFEGESKVCSTNNNVKMYF